jgi:hypothetical protein
MAVPFVFSSLNFATSASNVPLYTEGAAPGAGAGAEYLLVSANESVEGLCLPPNVALV